MAPNPPRSQNINNNAGGWTSVVCVCVCVWGGGGQDKPALIGPHTQLFPDGIEDRLQRPATSQTSGRHLFVAVLKKIKISRQLYLRVK